MPGGDHRLFLIEAVEELSEIMHENASYIPRTQGIFIITRFPVSALIPWPAKTRTDPPTIKKKMGDSLCARFCSQSSDHRSSCSVQHPVLTRSQGGWDLEIRDAKPCARRCPATTCSSRGAGSPAPAPGCLSPHVWFFAYRGDIC